MPLRAAEFSAESVCVGVGGLARVLGDTEAAPQLLLLHWRTPGSPGGWPPFCDEMQLEECSACCYSCCFRDRGLKMTQERWEEMQHTPGLKTLFLQSLQNHQARFQEKNEAEEQGTASQLNSERWVGAHKGPNLSELKFNVHCPNRSECSLMTADSRTIHTCPKHSLQEPRLFDYSGSHEALHSWNSGESCTDL